LINKVVVPDRFDEPIGTKLPQYGTEFSLGDAGFGGYLRRSIPHVRVVYEESKHVYFVCPYL